MPLLDLIDREKELERLSKEKEKLLSEINESGEKASNQTLLTRLLKKL